MPRQRTPVQVNQFVGGLNTEANPLNFPPTGSFDESNMNINRDGSRIRRLGFDVEEDYEVRTATNVSFDDEQIIGRRQFRWSNVGGASSDEFLVVQVGNFISIHNLDILPLSSPESLVYTLELPIDTYSTDYGFAIVDGALVMGTGEKQIYIFEYKNGAIELTRESLLIRDLFGVEVNIDGTELTSPINIQVRPSTSTQPHVYNLRNQGYTLPVPRREQSITLYDPIEEFNLIEGTYPSNADLFNEFYFPDPAIVFNTTIERYLGPNNVATLPRNSKAPVGYFIIDAMERGTSRSTREGALRAEHPELTFVGNTLPSDTTPGGPSVLAQYSGRVWYAGFSGEVVDGDNKSPRMSSYILFSQTVTDPSKIKNCFQEADPTSNQDADLVATDGGFIKIDGAYNISALVPIESSLFVLAENGVWRISGDGGNSFSATEFSISKLSDQGCISGSSAVVTDNSMLFWGEYAIYGIERNQFGEWQTINVSRNNIQRLYDSISLFDRSRSIGYYDPDNTTVRWLYGSDFIDRSSSEELILDLQFNVFTKNKIELPTGVSGLFTVSGGTTSDDNTELTVFTDVEDVTDNADEDVTVPKTNVVRDTTRSFYCILLNYGATVTYTFGQYRREDTTDDWTAFGEATDSPAFLLTGSITGGDGRLRKDVPYITTHFKQTDDETLASIDSSCVFSSQWDWTPNAETGKWTNPRQIYRILRDSHAGGIVSTRSKVRGSGRSVAFKFESEPQKNLHIYGWEFNLEATGDE